jgi:hypothetical protein
MTRGQASQLIVLYVLAAVVAVGGLRLVESLQTVNSSAREYRANEPSRRELAGAWLLDIDREFVQAAKAYVGPADTFAIATGPNVTTSSSVTLGFLATYLRSELLPAALVAPESADWVLCFGCDQTSYADFEAVWSRDGLAVLRRPA